MKKLYKIEMSGYTYVMAEDEDRAIVAAVRAHYGHSPEELGLEYLDPEEVEPDHTPEPIWVGGVPFGEDRDRSLEEILVEMRTPQEEVEPSEDDIREVVELLKASNCRAHNLVALKLEEGIDG